MINILPASDNTLLINFGDKISKITSLKLLRLAEQIINNSAEEIINISPSYNSLLVRLDHKTSLSDGKSIIKKLIEKNQNNLIIKQKIVEIPVCYDQKLGLDLNRVINHTGYKLKEIIKIHTKKKYFVHFIGFSIGFPYMSGLDKTLQTSRLNTPRIKVPSGSIGIAGEQTGIYPFSTPGGWNIIGRTPLKIFNKIKPELSIIQSGYEIRFKSISFKEYEKMKQ